MENTYQFINLALLEAQKAFDLGEIPVGAVIVKDNQVIATSHNLVYSTHNPTAHAEMLCIQEACKTLGTSYLSECELYVTLEPCAMCAGAISLSKLKKVIYS